MAIVRTYYSGLPSSNAWTTGVPASNKSAVIVSFKAQPTTILSGQDDAALSHFFDTAPTGNPIYWAYFHEPEGNIADGEFTLADYKAAWAHVVSLANAAHNPDLHSTLILGGYDFRPGAHRNWKDYLPGGGIISTLGWDAYPPGSAKNVNPIAAPPDAFMAQEIAAAKSVGLPYGFAEFGLSTAAGRPAWLSDVGNYLLHSGAVFATYFNGNAQYPTLKLTDSASVAVWKGFVAKSGSSAPGPAPAPASPAPSPTGTATSPAPSPTGTPASPAPSPTGTPTSPATDNPVVSGLALSPSTFAARPQEHTSITFSLNQASDVTALVLDQTGTVVRTIARPALAPGTHAIPYYGFNGSGHRVPTGKYQVLVVASNAHGSGTAESPLEIDAP
jgi:FlgD Ig-like domain